jgi:hypothetical protein
MSWLAFSEVSVCEAGGDGRNYRRDDQSERKSDRRHETIAPFLPVRMRTGLIMDLEPVGTGSEIFIQN